MIAVTTWGSQCSLYDAHRAAKLQTVFDLSGRLGGFNPPHWLRTTPLLVTMKFGLRPPQKGQKSKFIVELL